MKMSNLQLEALRNDLDRVRDAVERLFLSFERQFGGHWWWNGALSVTLTVGDRRFLLEVTGAHEVRVFDLEHPERLLGIDDLLAAL